jgi:hypothetical protein
VISLRSDWLEVEVDPDYGADVTSVTASTTGEQVLFQSPWRDHAQRAINDPRERIFSEPEASWLERYRGGWQILCPTAGRRGQAAEEALFHGEASRRRWETTDITPGRARLEVQLETAPLALTREVIVADSTVTVIDGILNTGQATSRFDVSQHIAFGDDLLDGECTIETRAHRFVSDWGIEGEPDAEVDLGWPARDLDVIPARPATRFALGWLSEFDQPVARLLNASRGIEVTLRWSAALPYAWLWQELDASPGWPWLSRTRVVGFEPSSTPTGGPRRHSVAVLDPGESLELQTLLTVETGVRREPTA